MFVFILLLICTVPILFSIFLLVAISNIITANLTITYLHLIDLGLSSMTAPLPILKQPPTPSNPPPTTPHSKSLGTGPLIGPFTIPDPALALALTRLAPIAIPLVLQLANLFNPGQGCTKVPVYIVETIGMRATLAATGAFPEYVRHNPQLQGVCKERTHTGMVLPLLGLWESQQLRLYT
ncbi:hypothetical protein B0H34DRAFT_798631 [Crassisporium funariophilum]|nr:hypothetical protein B0H34DRAFT_798631 [Crassisporium funariophilum]